MRRVLLNWGIQAVLPSVQISDTLWNGLICHLVPCGCTRFVLVVYYISSWAQTFSLWIEGFFASQSGPTLPYWLAELWNDCAAFFTGSFFLSVYSVTTYDLSFSHLLDTRALIYFLRCFHGFCHFCVSTHRSSLYTGGDSWHCCTKVFIECCPQQLWF